MLLVVQLVLIFFKVPKYRHISYAYQITRLHTKNTSNYTHKLCCLQKIVLKNECIHRFYYRQFKALKMLHSIL